MERHDGIDEKELSAESVLASIDIETAEQLTAIRARIVNHVRGLATATQCERPC
jgi:hypothetical protein